MKDKILALLHNKQKKRPLKWSMIGMLLLCWLMPLMLLALSMLFVVSNRMNKQIENTIKVSANKAIEICELRLNDAISASRFASYMPNIKESYLEHQRDGDDQKLYDEVTDFLTQQYRFNQNFLSTMVYFVDDPKMVYYTYRNGKDTGYYFNLLQFINSKIKTVQAMAEQMDTEVAFVNMNGRTYMVRNMMQSNYEPYAVIIMEINKESMFESLQSIWGYQDCEVFIGNEAVFDSTLSRKFDANSLSNSFRKSIYEKDENTAYVYQVNRIEKQNIAYVVELDSKAIISELDAIQYVFVLLLIFMIPLILLVLFFFHRKVTQPINSLLKATAKIAEGQYGVQIPEICTSKEFAYLGGSFNEMSGKLQSQFEKIYSEELALRDANIMALQSQINPHFLNNTLEIINWEARMMDNYKVSGMIEALSTMLEATMNRKKQQLIALSEELSYVDAYLFIISQRFGDKFQVEKNIDKSLLRVEVPRLIIQPIIENAVEHGMDIQKKGKVSIRIFAEGNFMHIEITDNGKLTEEDLKKIEILLSPEYESKGMPSTSLGIRNVDQRLRIIYGNDCGLFIRSNEDNNTVSTIIIKMERLERKVREEIVLNGNEQEL